MTKRHSLAAQAAEARRQFHMMQGVYPAMAAAGVIDRATIDCDLALMENAVATLEWLQRNEKLVRHAVAHARGEAAPIAGDA